ncbi:MAG: FGGY-family carbohydrate kinase [Eubacteriales bacterium]|nr:FGGY-family carbohydrate kinase [Eubacteriales bacterium]
MNILSLDIGTTSMRGILYDENGSTITMKSILTPLISDCKLNTMEQKPEVYTDGITEICKAIASEYTVDAISVTAFRSAPTLVDRSGNALHNFIMWQDTRNAEICSRLQYANRQVYKTTGSSINTVFTASKLTWFKENTEELYKRAYKGIIVPDYIIHFMTGAFSTDYTYGSRTLLMDIRSLSWSREMCELFRVDEEKLCDLVPQGSISGTVTKEFSQLTGIRQGVPVISAGGDQQCGALGLGVMDSATIEVNSGTGSFVISLTDEPELSNSSVICNVSAVPGKYTQEMNIIASASALNWLIREVFPEYWGEEPNFEAINKIAEETPAGCHGVWAIPHFQGCGSRSWNPDATAVFGGLTLSTHRNDMIRALYEGIASEIAKSINILPEVCREAKEIAVAGGLSNSDIYLKILCDMTGRKLIRSHNVQATGLGAFISAAAATGLYGSFPEALSAVRKNEECDVMIPNEDNVRFYDGYMRKTEKMFCAACTI